MNKIKEKIYTISTIIIIIDQFIKYIIINNIKLLTEVPLIKNVFSLYHVKNTGGAFSVLEGNIYLLIIISIIILYILDTYITKENQTKLDIISFGFLIGGIVGNLLDRIIHKGVIDYLLFKFNNYSFPIFNLADIFITIGVILLITSTILKKN